MKVILSDPPTGKFFGKVILEISAAPAAQMLVSGDEGPKDPSMQTYSNAYESTPSSSMNFAQMSRAHSLKMGESVDPETSLGISQGSASTLYNGSPAHFSKKDQASTLLEHSTGETA